MFKFKLTEITNDKYPRIINKIVETRNPNKHTMVFELISSNALVLSTVDKLQLYFSDGETSYDEIIIDSYTTIANTLTITFYVDLLEQSKIDTLRLNLYLNNTLYVSEIYKVEVLSNKTSKLTLNIVKTPKEELLLSPNFLLENSKQHVPIWSKAYEKTISNFAKVLDPFYKTVTSYYFTLHNYLAEQYFSKEINKTTLVNNVEKPLRVVDASGNTYLDVYSIESSPRKIISIAEEEFPLLLCSFNYNVTEVFKPIILEEPSILYLKQEIKNESNTILLTGLDQNNKFVTEVVFLVNSRYRPTVNEYKQVLTLVSAVNVELSNFIDCIKEHQYTQITSVPVPLFINKEKNFDYYNPEFRLERTESELNSVLSVYTQNTLKYYFCFDSLVTSFYIDPYLNMYWTTDNSLNMSNLALSLNTSSNSVTDGVCPYIYTDTPLYLNEWFDLIVDLPKLLIDYPDLDSLVVSLVTTDGVVKYLNAITEIFEETKTLIYIKDPYSSKINISLKLSNLDEYVFKIILKNKVFVHTLKVPCIFNTNTVSLANSTLIIQNNTVKVNTTEVPTIDYVFSTEEDLENKLFVFFVWEHAGNLDYKVNVSQDFITNEAMTVSDSLCNRIYYDGNTNVEGFSLDIRQIKQTYAMENLTFTLHTSFRPESNINTSKVISKVLFYSKDIEQEFLLTSKDSDTYEYEFTLANNLISGTLNANY